MAGIFFQQEGQKYALDNRGDIGNISARFTGITSATEVLTVHFTLLIENTSRIQTNVRLCGRNVNHKPMDRVHEIY